MGKQASFSDKVLWYGTIFGGILVLLSAVPVVPWRYAKVDTNVGNRFCMERYYTLFGASDQMGKSVNWFTLKKKIQRKNEEFGRPSPVTAILGTIGGSMGTGGAALGCAMWQKCKDHVSARYMNYQTVAICGLCSFMALLFSAFCAFATAMWQGFEDGHKKKKKKSDSLSPEGKTMTWSIFSFMFGCGGVCGFLFVLDNALKDFKSTAYYPYAGSHAGPFVGGFGCFILFIMMMICINRCYHCCDRKEQEEDQGMMGPPQYQGGYDQYGQGGYAQQGW